MNYPETTLADFLKQIKTLPSFSNIKSIMLGGSYAKGKTDKMSDIDILFICKEKTSYSIYKEIQNLAYNEEFNKILDVKIIDEENIKLANDSVQSPFFYHLIEQSKILHGDDFRSKFKLNLTRCYQAIIQKLDKLEKVSELAFIYNQPKEAEVLLFGIAKNFVVIHELFSKESTHSKKSNEEYLNYFFGNKTNQIREYMRKYRTWISIYDRKGKENVFGFNLVKIKKRKATQIGEEYESYIIEAIKKVSNFGKQCLDLINI